LSATLCVPEDTCEMYSCLHGPTALKILGTKIVELRLTGSSGIHCTLQWMPENLTDEAAFLNPRQRPHEVGMLTQSICATI
jgi:hypothetical protein